MKEPCYYAGLFYFRETTLSFTYSFSLQNVFNAYDKLLDYEYIYLLSTSNIDSPLEVHIQFLVENFYHLGGFHYFDDITSISSFKRKSKREFFIAVRDGAIATIDILNSSKYDLDAQKRFYCLENMEKFLDTEQKFYDFDGKIPLIDLNGNKRVFESLVNADFIMKNDDADINFIFTFLTKTTANEISYCYPKSIFSPDFDYSYGQTRRCILAKYKRNKKAGVVETMYLYPVYLKRNPQLVQKEFDYILTDKKCCEIGRKLYEEKKINLNKEQIEKINSVD